MALHLMPRDLSLLSEIGELGVLDTATIHARHWADDTGIRACQSRLKKLDEAGLVRKAELAVSAKATLVKKSSEFGGSQSTAWTLTPHGGDVVELETGHRPTRVQRKELKERTLLHRLDTVHMRIAVDDACRNAGIQQPVWIMEHDSYEKVKLSDPLENRLLLYERFPITDTKTVSCRPDASCLLHIPRPKNASQSDPLIVYWEIDRGTNDVAQERAKVAGFDALFKTDTYRRHWPTATKRDHAVRVFYVCPDLARIESIIAGLKTLDVVKKNYRFAKFEAARDCQRVLEEPVWQDSVGNFYSILRKSAN